MKVTQSCLTLCDPMDYPVHSLGLSLLQGIFPIQRLNWGLQHCRHIFFFTNQAIREALFLNMCLHVLVNTTHISLPCQLKEPRSSDISVSMNTLLTQILVSNTISKKGGIGEIVDSRTWAEDIQRWAWSIL